MLGSPESSPAQFATLDPSPESMSPERTNDRGKEVRAEALLGKIELAMSQPELTEADRDVIFQNLDSLEQMYESWPLAEVLPRENIQQAYETSRLVMEEAGILTRLPSGEQGIVDIAGEPCPLPSFERVVDIMAEKAELLRPKIEQGFVRLIVVPFGVPLGRYEVTKDQTEKITGYGDGLLGAYASFLTKQAKTDSNPNGLNVNLEAPMHQHYDYNNADTRSDGLVYYPEQFDQATHGGKTKQEVLDTLTIPGWQVLLVEDMPEVPRENRGETKGGRKQFECKQTAQESLAKIGTPFEPSDSSSHEAEIGLTFESYLMANMTHLKNLAEANEPLKALDEETATSLLGIYLPSGDNVPYAYWYRDYERASLSRNGPDVLSDDIGSRSAVRVS